MVGMCNTYMCMYVGGKKKWPELVGVSANVAAQKIEKENPNVHTVVLLQGSPTTPDYKCDRVRLWVDLHGVVTAVPQIG